MDIHLTVPPQFPFPKDLEWNTHEWFELSGTLLRFWYSKSTIGWFEARGYTLYKKRPTSEPRPSPYSLPTKPCPPSVEGEFPYAYHDDFLTSKRDIGLERMGRDLSASVVYAQDVQGRHVAIKLVPEGSDEHRINEMVRQQPTEFLKENGILPVLEILYTKGYCFVVMPRWGPAITRPDPETLGEVIPILRSMLRALAFFHSQRIIHRDISFENTLVNHFSEVDADWKNPRRRKLRSDGLLCYALFDYDLSMIMPEGSRIGESRLPYAMSMWGHPGCLPNDTSQGEYDYDPFAYDVGMIGIVFCSKFQHLSHYLHFLAPLFDRMTTRFIPQRFTAQEALDFMEECVAELPESALEAGYPPDWFNGNDVQYDEYNRWSGVPPELVEKWVVYQEPRLTESIRNLRWICSFKILHVTISWGRWIRDSLTLWRKAVYHFQVGSFKGKV